MKTTFFYKPASLITLFFFLAANLFLLPGDYGSVQAFSVGDEKEIGEQLLAVVRKEFKLLDDPDITQYINELGQEILKVSGPQYFDYHFFVIKNKQFNAFAAPSGLIFFHTGLIETMDNENELASVMAHEIGHVQSRHIAERIEKSSKLSIGTMALILAGLAVGNGAVSEALITGSVAANASMNLSFSRKDEEEADRLAFKWLKESNRDPEFMTGMLKKMYRVDRLHREMVPPYLLTHPEPDKRLSYVQDLLLMNKGKSYAKIDDFAFQRFKYRVLNETKDSSMLIALYKKESSQTDAPASSSIMAHYGLALAYIATAEFAKAIDSLKKVIAYYPDELSLSTDLGVIYFQEGKYKEAHELFQKVRNADPNSAYNTFYLAKTHEQQGDKQKALAYYQELLPVLSNYSRLHYNIGEIFADSGNKGAGHYHLGMYYFQEGDPKNSTYHFNKAIQNLKPGSKLYLESQAHLVKIKKISKGN